MAKRRPETIAEWLDHFEAKRQPEGIEGKKVKLRAILYHLQEACLHTVSCKECPLGTEICDEGGGEFYPSRWNFGK